MLLGINVTGEEVVIVSFFSFLFSSAEQDSFWGVYVIIQLYELGIQWWSGSSTLLLHEMSFHS